MYVQYDEALTMLVIGSTLSEPVVAEASVVALQEAGVLKPDIAAFVADVIASAFEFWVMFPNGAVVAPILGIGVFVIVIAGVPVSATPLEMSSEVVAAV